MLNCCKVIEMDKFFTNINFLKRFFDSKTEMFCKI